jgi:hypothetical protein
MDFNRGVLERKKPLDPLQQLLLSAEAAGDILASLGHVQAA